MKIIYHFLIILFVALSLFIMRDDVVSVLNKVSVYLDKNINQNSMFKLIEKKEVQLPGKVDVPGALRVMDNLLSSNSNVKLSKSNVILITNKYRKENGNLSELKENQKLDLSAEKKLQDMFAKQYFEHTSPLGVGVGDLGGQVGYEYILIGENLALGNFKNDTALLDAWMASPGHRANILNKSYSEIGVAVGKGKFEGRDTWMAVQHFGTPMSVCPSVDKVLLGIINIDQNKIEEMSKNLLLRLNMINKNVLYEGSTLYEQTDKYNSLINIYNSLVKETKQKIDSYNKQIKEFNSCVLNKE